MQAPLGDSTDKARAFTRRRPSGRDELLADRDSHQARGLVDAELLHQARAVALDGSGRDVKGFGDLLVA